MLTLTRARTLIAFISLMKQFRKELCMRPTHAGARCCACGRQGRQGVPALHARAHHGAPPPLFRRCECGRGVPRLHGEIAIHRGPVPPHPGVGCLIWMGATSGPRWLSAFGGDACACILYGGLAGGRWLAFSTVVWVWTVGLASGWFGRGRQRARVGVLGVVLGVMKRKHALELRCDMFSVC